MDEYSRRMAKYDAMKPMEPPIKKSRMEKRKLEE